MHLGPTASIRSCEAPSVVDIVGYEQKIAGGYRCGEVCVCLQNTQRNRPRGDKPNLKPSSMKG